MAHKMFVTSKSMSLYSLVLKPPIPHTWILSFPLHQHFINDQIESVKTTSIWNDSTEVLCRKKHYLRHENKVNENKILSHCKALRCKTIKTRKKLFSFIKYVFQQFHGPLSSISASPRYRRSKMYSFLYSLVYIKIATIIFLCWQHSCDVCNFVLWLCTLQESWRKYVRSCVTSAHMYGNLLVNTMQNWNELKNILLCISTIFFIEFQFQ